MPFPAKAVANFFIQKALSEGVDVTPMKLQKLVYYAHGWYLSYSNGQPLINERVAAWQYGPVIPTLYQDFKDFGNNPITRQALGLEFRDGKWLWETPAVTGDPLAQNIMAQVWGSYGKLSAAILSNATHTPGSPWYEVYEVQRGKEQLNAIIPDDLIKKYFDSQRSQRQPAPAAAG